jgi:gliding motility-associated protein GldM
MAEKKETPRQKMIGMMYLVLTALLAMNVSKEVLMGFVTVNESLERTNRTFNESTQTMMDYFAKYVQKNPGEKYYYTKAGEAAKLTGDMYEYIERLKKKLVETTESRTKQQADTSRLRYVDALDNYDVPTFELFGDDETNPKKSALSAFELRQKLTETHDKILSIFEGEDIRKKFLSQDLVTIRKKISAIKPVDPGTMVDGVSEDWQMANFYNLPLAAVVTNLSKIQSDLRNVESETVNTIAKSVMSTIPKIDQFVAAVVSKTNYVQIGEKYQSQIFLAAGSSTVKREIFIGDWDSLNKTFRGDFQQLAIDANGRAVFEQAGTSQGERAYKGVIKMTKETGEIEYFPFQEKFTVAPQSVAVTNENMNVVYAGIDNPLIISAAGIAPQNLRVNVDNGIIPTTGTGTYKLHVDGGKEVNVNISAQTENGVKKQGSVKLKVKYLPKPELKLSGKGGDDRSITKAEFAAATWVTAKPEGFIMNLPYPIKTYDVLFVNGSKNMPFTVTGGKVTQAMKDYVRTMSPGGRILIEAVAVSPDRKEHNVSLSLKLK